MYSMHYTSQITWSTYRCLVFYNKLTWDIYIHLLLAIYDTNNLKHWHMPCILLQNYPETFQSMYSMHNTKQITWSTYICLVFYYRTNLRRLHTYNSNFVTFMNFLAFWLAKKGCSFFDESQLLNPSLQFKEGTNCRFYWTTFFLLTDFT